MDITDFIGKQVRILTDSIFGNIGLQDAPSLTMTKGANKYVSQHKSETRGRSYKTTVTTVELRLRQDLKITNMLKK